MHRRLSVLTAGVIALLAIILPPTSPSFAQTGACQVNGSAARYNLTLNDFGRGGEPYTLREDPDYWGGFGHLIAFQRADYDAWMSSPIGGSVFSGVVVAADATSASDDVRSAVSGWTSAWKSSHEIKPPTQVGEEMIMVTRLTTWEITAQQPMTEVFLAFRRCNASGQINLLIMPKLDPVNAALHYARILDQRLRG